MADMPTPEVQKGVPKGIIAAVGAVGITAAAVGGYAATRGEPVKTTPPPPDHTAAASSPTPPDKTVIPTPTGKVEVSIPPTKTPEVKKDVPCQILPTEYCNQAERVDWLVANKTYTFIGFNFPAGVRVPIFAPVDGHLLLSKESNQPFLGMDANIKTASGENYDFKGNIDTSKFGSLLDISIKAGDIVGYAQSTTAKSLGYYDVVYTISKAGASGPEVV